MSLEALESKKDDVLNETVAQDIFRELKDLRAYVDTHGKRWVLELIQNALDASKENGVDVKINFDGSTLLFSHNGRAFTEEELIHLIYHGSTKLDSEGTSGKLGTGFLASHLLSPRVNVKGTLRDMQGFKFILDRDADGVKQLTDKMKDTWDQLRKSLHPVENNNGLDTSYEYHIETPEQADIYRKGISILIETAPIILAFDKRLRSISIKEAGGEFVWSAKESSNSSLIDINLIHNGIPEESKICSLIVVRRDKTSVAVPLTRKNGMLSVLNTIDIPKLYYPLPLIGSNGFPSPFLISNSGFVPTKDREGALLTSGIKEEDVKGNRQIIETAFGILDEFFELLSKGGYGDLHNVARLPELEKVRSNYSKWLDETWMEQLVRTLIEKIRSRSVLSTENGTIPPKDSKIPILVGIQDGPNRQEKLKKMWALAAKVFPKSTPTEEYAETWEEILSEWLAHQSSEEQQSEPFAEVLTIEKLSKIAEENGNLNDLQSSIEGSSAIEWLNDLLTLIQMLKKDTLFDEQRILSDQNGIFRTRKGLYRDSEISEELKDIATMLGYYVRTELLMNGVVSAALTNSRTEKEILLETLKRIKDQSKADHQKENYQKANVKLFQWLIEGKKFEEIRESFPVLTHGKDIGEGDYLYSFSAENKFLTPEAIWKEENKKHIDVFPPRAILSNIYSNLGQECWSLLEESNLVFQNLSFAQAVLLSDKQVRALSFEEINESDDGDHKSKDRVHVSTVPFLEDKDWGVMDRISGKERAARFLSFILDNLIKNDASWKKPTTVACSCGSTHQIYPSVWLEALRTRQWVPVSGGKGEKPSSENLAPFFAQNELARLLGDDDATHFLGILGVNVSVLMTANKSKVDRIELDRAFSRLLAATNMDPQQLGKLADAYSDEGLRKKLLDAVLEKELVNENRKVGMLVERLIREGIAEKLPKDICKVEEVTIGSDIKIALNDAVEPSNDFMDETGRELFVKISSAEKQHLIEVKSTRENSVRMTIPQAKQAHGSSSAFTLCVVEVNKNIMSMSDEEAKMAVTQNARFVFPIGDKLGDMLNEVDAFLRGEKELGNQSQDIQVDIISEAQIRIRVNQGIWQNGLDFGDFIRLIERAVTRPDVAQQT